MRANSAEPDSLPAKASACTASVVRLRPIDLEIAFRRRRHHFVNQARKELLVVNCRQVRRHRVIKRQSSSAPATRLRGSAPAPGSHPPRQSGGCDIFAGSPPASPGMTGTSPDSEPPSAPTRFATIAPAVSAGGCHAACHNWAVSAAIPFPAAPFSCFAFFGLIAFAMFSGLLSLLFGNPIVPVQRIHTRPDLSGSPIHRALLKER